MTETDISEKNIESVRDLLVTLSKALKTFNVYPKDNPIYQKFVDEIASKFSSYFEKYGDLVIDVKPNILNFGDRVVYQSDDRTDNIALLLYTDGIRQLTFNKGIPTSEMMDFVDVLMRAPKAENIQDDVVTLLWEKNLKGLSYVVAQEVITDDMVFSRPSAEDKKDEDEEGATLYGAYYSDVNIKPMSISLKAPQLTDEELKRVAEELKSTEARSLYPLITGIILNLLAIEHDNDEFFDLIAHVGRMVETRVKAKDFKAVERMLVKLWDIYEHAVPERRKHLNSVIEKAGTIEHIEAILSESPECGDDLCNRLGLFGSEAVPIMIRMLGDLEDRKQRRFLCDVLAEIGKNAMGAFSEALEDERWYLVRNLLMVFGLMKEPEALKHIEKVLHHPEPRVRREAARALENIAHDDSKRLLLRMLDDPETLVRATVYRALKRYQESDVFEALKLRADRERIKDIPFAEKKELLETLGATGLDKAFPALSELFKKRGIIEKDEVTEIRAAAAYGLGQVGSAEAVALLEKEIGSKRPLLRDSCAKAVLEAKRIARKK